MPEPDYSPSNEIPEQGIEIPVMGEIAAGFPIEALEVITAVTITPFVTSFFNELGKRLGDKFPDWMKGVKLRFRREDLEIFLPAEAGREKTTIEIDGRLPDAAWLALLDLNVDSDAIRGHQLRWDSKAGGWLTAEQKSG
jgi:hypothetical protein